MNQLKVCVYAISKNESSFVERWVQSMKEADEIYVLDTGSSDDTVERLKQLGVHVIQKEIYPWRFDVARNESLNLVPMDTDICVCTDLDEVFEEGWRTSLENLWKKHFITRVKYLYHWSFDAYGNPATTFHINKIHSRNGYFWKHPVHEVLVPEENFQEIEIMTDDFVLNHYPDAHKSRGSYLPLLEMSVEEDPEDDRNMHYLGREYMYYGKWQKAIETLHRHLNLSRATWKDERCASMRFIARCYARQGFFEEATLWYLKALEEAPYLRESYLELAFLKYYQKNYTESYHYAHQALSITEKSNSYINEPFAWDYHVYDLLSILSFELHFYEEAFLYAKKALQLNPKDKRIRNNVKLIRNYLKNKKSNE